ncbi:MAG TPA: hypothetical protein V6C81_04230 [Planktothrix sp.]|jgi:hypothetical protein
MTFHKSGCEDNSSLSESSAQSTAKEPTLDFNAVHGFATQLSSSSRDNIGQTLNQIDNYLAHSSEGLRQEFFDCLNSDLGANQKLGQVMDTFVHSSYLDQYGQKQNTYDFLRQGHKRMSDQDMAQDINYFDSIGRSAESNLMQNMLGGQGDIEKAHYEGAFLGIGGSVSGVDQKRLDKYAKNETKTREAGDIADLFGLDSTGYMNSEFFQDISAGKGFVTKQDVKDAITYNAMRPPSLRYDEQEMAALTFMRDNFGKVADYSLNPDGDKTINAHSLLHFAKKQKVSVAPSYDTYE